MRYLLLLLSVFATASHAAEWVFFTANEPERSVIYVDISSIDRTAIVRDFWMQNIHETQKTTENGPVKVDLSKFRVGCKDKQIGLVRLVQYDDKGSVTYSNELNKPPMEGIVPDSLGDNLATYVCDNKRLAKSQDYMVTSPKTHAAKIWADESTEQSVEAEWR